MELNQFLSLSTQSINSIVQSKKGKKNTIVFAYDGTRRSYLIENFIQNSTLSDATLKIDYSQYSKTAFKKLLYHLVMMFQHGIQTIVYPMWFCTLENRGPEYLPKFIQYLWGVVSLLEDEELFNQYQKEGIRVIFYGEYIDLLRRGNDPILLEKFEQIMEKTKHNTEKIVLFGTNIDEPTNTIIKNSLNYYTKNGKVPNKEELIKQYYGVEVEDVSMYIGFDRFSTDGRPILISDKGNEDLYYTVSPHSFFGQSQFRKILFDHLYCRTVTNAKEYELKLIDVEMMKSFYSTNAQSVMGVGAIQSYGNFWYPLPQAQPLGADSASTTPPQSPVKSPRKLDVPSLKLMGIDSSNHGSIDSGRSLTSSGDSGNGDSDNNVGFSSPPTSPKYISNKSSSSLSCNSSSPSNDQSCVNSAQSTPQRPSSPLSVSNKYLSPGLLQRMQPFLQSN